MTSRYRKLLRSLPLLMAIALWHTAVQGQTTAPTHVDPYQNGAAPAFPTRGGARTSQPGQTFGTGIVDPMSIDPMALNYFYGPGIPMTRGQVGLSAISSMQRMTGLGSGQISGVRGSGVEMEARRSSTHTRNPNVPGGQASRFFNRITPKMATSVAASASAPNSQKFYNRQSHYFPQPAR